MIQNTISSYSYGVCIRQEEGYCCVRYTPCSDSNSYSLDNLHATQAMQDQLCTEDWVGIAGKTFFTVFQMTKWQIPYWNGVQRYFYRVVYMHGFPTLRVQNCLKI